MSRKDLKNKPLVEAIMEIRWELSPKQSNAGGRVDIIAVSRAPGQPDIRPASSIDPHYRILVGRFFERVQGEYGNHVPLQTAHLPDELSAHQVQHQFRSSPDGWPLIQLGPGILTLNHTQGYVWDDFKPRALRVMETLLDSHPKPESLNIDSISLRYIDAVDVDYKNTDIGAFLRTKMGIRGALPEKLFLRTGVSQRPETFNWKSSYSCPTPPGVVTAAFNTGTREGRQALIWETMFRSRGKNVPTSDAFEAWLDAAHNVTHDWFFELIEGELERSFDD